MRLPRDQNAFGRAERHERSQNAPHVVPVSSDARRELAVGPRPRAALAVAQVGVLVQFAPREERADVAAALLHGLAALEDGHGDAPLRQRQRGEQTARAHAHDHHAVVGGVAVRLVRLGRRVESVVEVVQRNAFFSVVLSNPVLLQVLVPVPRRALASLRDARDDGRLDLARRDDRRVYTHVVHVDDVLKHGGVFHARVARFAHEPYPVPVAVAE